MARGVSLHIGLNEVDPNHYKDGDGNPWKGELAACEADVHAMVDLATAQKFDVRGSAPEQAGDLRCGHR